MQHTGFVYVYSLLYKITNAGQDILLGQYIFIAFYMINLTIVFAIYKQTKLVHVFLELEHVCERV